MVLLIILIVILLVVLVVLLALHLFRSNAAQRELVNHEIGTVCDLSHLYPNSLCLPAKYAALPLYQNLARTIEHFVMQSLNADGIAFSSVRVDISGDSVLLSIQSSTPDLEVFVARYKQSLAIFLRALAGVKLCKSRGTSSCPWDAAEYVLFPPFGLPLVNYDFVVFLHFPPISSLVKGDYNDNQTIARFTRLLATVGLGANFPLIDLEPIAAPSTAKAFPDALEYFGDYLACMLAFFLDGPRNRSETRTLPLIVMGADVIHAWSRIIKRGGDLNVGDHGLARVPFTDKVVPWIVGWHPNVTSYQCCPNDPCSKCTDRDLVSHERDDLIMLKWLSLMVKDNTLCADIAGQQARQWLRDHPEVLCQQARLDYNWSSNAGCATVADAARFCRENGNNACPQIAKTCSGILSGCSGSADLNPVKYCCN